MTSKNEPKNASAASLTAAECEQIHQALAEQKQYLTQNAQEGLSLSMNREHNIGRDSIDESMEEELLSTELRLRDREKFLLGKIGAAMERLAKGTINQCEDCGEAIGFKRLLARPVTTLCIDCKEMREKDEEVRSQPSRGETSEMAFGAAGGEETGGGSEKN